MTFLEFSQYLQKLESISSRNELTLVLVDLLNALDPSEVKNSMYLIQGRLVPQYVNTEFNFSGKLIVKAIAGKSLDPSAMESQIKSILSVKGDMGHVVEELLNQKDFLNNFQLGLDFSPSSNEPSIQDVYKSLENIAISSGKGSQEQKMDSYFKLILSLDPQSAKYVTRIIIGDLRLGLSDKTILDSLSWFCVGDKSIRKKIDTAFGNRADIGDLAEQLVKSKSNTKITDEGNLPSLKLRQAGNEELQWFQQVLNSFTLIPGTPVASKLVERESDSEKIWERMPNCFVQPKLDGLRGQMHFVKGEAFIFSRNMENMSEQFPEIHKSLEALGVDSIILDSEIIGFDKSTDSYLLFQETMKRKRKYDVLETSNKIPIKAMCFDILYLNGIDLTQKPIEERLSLLKNLLDKNVTDSLEMLETKQVYSVEELENYFIKCVSKGLEGIITKQVTSDYEPGTRNFKWIKLKANTKSELVDTIDVAVLGYYYGKGSRAKFGVGTLLAGVYNPTEDKYYSIGKVGSGFTDEALEQIYKDLQELKIDAKPENVVVDKSLAPDVWVRPTIVMEIVADEITRSPVHTAAIGVKAQVKNDDPEKGLSIRFPRMKKWKRDKEYPNTVDEIIRMYELRKGGLEVER